MVQSAHKARVKSREAIKVIAGLGALSSVLVLPGSAILLGELMKVMDKRSAKRTMSYLKYKKLVTVREKADGSVEYKLSKKAFDAYRRHQIDALAISTPRKWDRKWRMVMFDIPTEKNLARQQLLSKLKEMNFYMLQRSTWIHPFDCEIEVGVLLSELDLEKYVSYLVVDSGNFEDHAKKHFVKSGLLV